MPQEHPRRLIDFLPAVYRRSEGISAFLAPFDTALFGTSAGTDASEQDRQKERSQQQHQTRNLDEQIDRIPSLLDPYDTPEEFLSWLAQWAAVTLYWEARDRRRVIAEMIPLYRTRGTREYLARVLGLYVDGSVTVDEEDLPGMAVGVPERTEVGLNTRLGEDSFRFGVRIDFRAIPAGPEARLRLVPLARKVIDLAKPAYTHYRLSHNLAEEERGLVISVRSTIGFDTVLESRDM